MKPIVTRYPESIEPFRTFIVPQIALRKISEAYPSLQNPFYIMTRRAVKVIKFKCAKCKAFMNYEMNEEKVYVFVEGDLEHTHPISHSINARQPSQLGRFGKEVPTSDAYTIESLYVTVQMTNNYRLHYRCVYLSLLKMKGFYMLAISSSTPSREIVMFAIALLYRPVKTKIGSIIAEFFKDVKEEYLPDTLICNNLAVMELAQDIFKGKKTCFIHCQHETTASFRVRYGISRLVESVTVHEDWDKETRRFAIYVKENIPSSETRQLVEMRKGVCLPFLPETFVGLGVQVFHSLIIEQTGQENSFYTGDPVTFLRTFPIKIKTSFQEFPYKFFLDCMYQSNFNLLEPLYDLVELPVLRFLIAQYHKVMYCDLEPQPDGAMLVRSSTQAIRCTSHEGRWQCECRLIARTGLPCCHLMKVLLMLEAEMVEYVDEWWLGARGKHQEEPKNFMELK